MIEDIRKHGLELLECITPGLDMDESRLDKDESRLKKDNLRLVRD